MSFILLSQELFFTFKSVSKFCPKQKQQQPKTVAMCHAEDKCWLNVWAVGKMAYCVVVASIILWIALIWCINNVFDFLPELLRAIKVKGETFFKLVWFCIMTFSLAHVCQLFGGLAECWPSILPKEPYKFAANPREIFTLDSGNFPRSILVHNIN